VRAVAALRACPVQLGPLVAKLAIQQREALGDLESSVKLLGYQRRIRKSSTPPSSAVAIRRIGGVDQRTSTDCCRPQITRPAADASDINGVEVGADDQDVRLLLDNGQQLSSAVLAAHTVAELDECLRSPCHEPRDRRRR